MLYKPAIGYSKIATANNRTRARLLQQSNSLQNTTNNSMNQLTDEPFYNTKYIPL